LHENRRLSLAIHRIELTDLLSDAENRAIDAFCKEHRSEKTIPALATFLDKQFAISLATDPGIVEGFATDSSHLPGQALAVARPANERECAIILRTCHKAEVPVTLSGGRSNLTGSATPEGGLVLSTSRMIDPHVQVHAASRTAVVPVGPFLEDIRKEILRQSDGLCFPVDPTSRADASLGGCLACNASGFTPGAEGSIRHWVEAIRFLLPDGMLIEATRGSFVSEEGRFILTSGGRETVLPVPRYPRPAVKNAGGPFSSEDGIMDFIDLIVGAEGIFGLVTQCTLRLADRPVGYLDLFLSLPTEADALALLNAARKQLGDGLKGLSAFEYFGVNCRKYMKHEDRFFHEADEVAVYIQEPLFGKDMLDAAEAWLGVVEEAGLEIDEEAILLLDTQQLRDLFLEARHSMPANALEVVQHRGAFTIMTDCVVPADHFAAFLEFTHDTIRSRGMDYLSFGHLGDCHLHFTILPQKDQVDLGVEAYDAIVAKSAELGGVYSGEHGTGKRKRKDFLRCHGERGVEDVKRSKSAVDPLFLMNHGIVIQN
jgi:D-lactate dehydrogenase (cytochrome)